MKDPVKVIPHKSVFLGWISGGTFADSLQLCEEAVDVIAEDDDDDYGQQHD